MLALVGCADDKRGRDVGIVGGGGPQADDPDGEIPRFLPREGGIERRWLVVLATDDMDDEDEGAVHDRVDALADEYVAGVEQRYSRALAGFLADVDEEGARAISEDARVRFVEQDGYTRINEVQSGATWGLDRIDQRASALDGRYAYETTGAGVTAYIIDTGIEFGHTEFAGRAERGTDLIADGQDGVDCNGHGTHVAGTVGGRTYGVAKDVSLVAVRAYDCNGDGQLSRDISAIEWVAANAVRPAVANMSASGGASPSYATAVQKMTDAGIPFVVAAGNASADACSYSPANVPDAITVGATNRDDGLADFSNTGSCVDVLAPGVGITSAWHTAADATNTIDGTSMASPHVAGIVARYLEGHPGADVSEVTEAILSSATSGTATPPAGTTDLLAFASVEATMPADPDGSGDACPAEWRGDGICDECLGDDPDCDGNGSGESGGTEGGDDTCPAEYYGDGICDVCLGDDPDCDDGGSGGGTEGGDDMSCPAEWYDDGICDDCLGDDPDCGIDPDDSCPAEYYGDGVCDECLGDDPDCDDTGGGGSGGGEYCPDEWYGDGYCDECFGDDPDC